MRSRTMSRASRTQVAAREAEDEEARVLTGPDRGRQEARDKRLVSRGGEVTRRVPPLPGPATAHQLPGHVVAPRVEGDEPQVVRVDQQVNVDPAGATGAGPRERPPAGPDRPAVRRASTAATSAA